MGRTCVNLMPVLWVVLFVYAFCGLLASRLATLSDKNGSRNKRPRHTGVGVGPAASAIWVFVIVVGVVLVLRTVQKRGPPHKAEMED